MSILLTGMKRYLQDDGCCGLAAVASVAHYHDRANDYHKICQLRNPDGDGLYTPEIGILLNSAGFQKVTIISADLDILDFAWKRFSKRKIISQLRSVKSRHEDANYRKMAHYYVEFLSKQDNNSLVIGMNFGDYIRKALSQNTPVMISFNWHLFFNHPKTDASGKNDPIRGESEQHEVVVYGFDDNGVNILDSHYKMYKNNLCKYRKGRYRMSWEALMTVMGNGDVIIPEDYHEQLVQAG